MIAKELGVVAHGLLEFLHSLASPSDHSPSVLIMVCKAMTWYKALVQCVRFIIFFPLLF
jgi:hypothetical protein